MPSGFCQVSGLLIWYFRIPRYSISGGAEGSGESDYTISLFDMTRKIRVVFLGIPRKNESDYSDLWCVDCVVNKICNRVVALARVACSGGIKVYSTISLVEIWEEDFNTGQ